MGVINEYKIKKGELGRSGRDGRDGARGDKGERGWRGEKGEKGDKGDRGLKGDKGDKGDRGLQGLTGAKGDKGDKGDTGARGERGADGNDGRHGKNGIDGLNGINGLNGKDGINGKDGKDGKDGTSLDFEWDGTKLGVGKEGKKKSFVDLAADSDRSIINVSGTGNGHRRLKLLNDVSFDVPSNNDVLTYNSTTEKWEAAGGGGGGGTWGSVTGTLSDQTDLQTALDTKITASSSDTLTNKSGNISQWTNDSAYITGITGSPHSDLSDMPDTTGANSDHDKRYSPRSTGVLTGGVVTINSGDSAKFDISAGTGFVVDAYTDAASPSLTYVSWNAFTAQTVPNIATEPTTMVGIDVNGAITLSNTDWTNAQRRDVITLGIVGHPNNTAITAVGPDFRTGFDDPMDINDMAEALGNINVTGNVFTADAAGNLELNKSAGSTFKIGGNYTNSTQNPNTVTDAALDPVTFSYLYQDGAGDFTVGAPTTNIDPANYDNGTGTLAAVGAANPFSIQRIYFFTNSNFVAIHYGQATYKKQVDAVAAIESEVFSPDPSLARGSFRGWLIVERTTTDLTVAADAKFISAGKFGSVAGAVSASVSDLQAAYNNSVTPEILTDSTRGAVTMKRGSAADTDDVIEVLNGSGSQTFSVTGAGIVAASGAISGSNLSGTNTGDQTSIVGITGTKAQFDTAVTDGNITYDGDNVSVLTNDANYIDSSGAPVQSVNTQTGTVVLDADDISDAATTNKFTTAGDITKLSGIETAADVTDTANVTAAGALMDSEVTNLADVKAFNPADYAAASHTHATTDITSGTFADARIAASNVTQHEASLTITESQISDLAHVAEASQAQQEAAAATTVYVSPAKQHFHPSAAKVWVVFNGTGTVAIGKDYNVTSITDNGTGDYTVNFAITMGDAAYQTNCFAGDSLTVRGPNRGMSYANRATTSVQVYCHRQSDGAAFDMPAVNVAIHGDI